METISKGKVKNHTLKVGSKNLNSENWKVFNPNGKHMFTCGERKALWYLDRNLAKRIGSKSIELTFKPKGNGYEDNEIFGRCSRITRCVVTGLLIDLQRHHIVPYCYRTYFPEAYKSKNHHDVVLINHLTHAEYEQIANDFKDEIAQIYGVKTISELNTEYTAKLREIGKRNSILLNTIHSIFKSFNKLPNSVILEKLKFISDETEIPFDLVKTFNYIQLYKLYTIIKKQHIQEVYDFKDKNRFLYDHGYHVVQKLDNDEKMGEFVKIWRKHFINTMKPKFMPKGWSIDFRVKTKI
jgi:hypothetical protein